MPEAFKDGPEFTAEKELQMKWHDALWKFKNNSHADYGEFPDDLVDIVVAATDLKRPEPDSPLEEYVASVLAQIEHAENVDREQDRIRGYIRDDEDNELPAEALNIGRQ